MMSVERSMMGRSVSMGCERRLREVGGAIGVMGAVTAQTTLSIPAGVPCS